MSRTKAVHVRYNSWYISLSPFADQPLETNDNGQFFQISISKLTLCSLFSFGIVLLYVKESRSTKQNFRGYAKERDLLLALLEHYFTCNILTRAIRAFRRQGLGDRLVSGQTKYSVEDAERNLANHLTNIFNSKMTEQDKRQELIAFLEDKNKTSANIVLCVDCVFSKSTVN